MCTQTLQNPLEDCVSFFSKELPPTSSLNSIIYIYISSINAIRPKKWGLFGFRHAEKKHTCDPHGTALPPHWWFRELGVPDFKQKHETARSNLHLKTNENKRTNKQTPYSSSLLKSSIYWDNNEMVIDQVRRALRFLSLPRIKIHSQRPGVCCIASHSLCPQPLPSRGRTGLRSQVHCHFRLTSGIISTSSMFPVYLV